MNLDVFDLCSEELQQKLIPIRTKFKEEEDKLAERNLKVYYGHTFILKLTCAFRLVGSYATLSVCLFVIGPKFRRDNDSHQGQLIG